MEVMTHARDELMPGWHFDRFRLRCRRPAGGPLDAQAGAPAPTTAGEPRTTAAEATAPFLSRQGEGRVVAEKLASDLVASFVYRDQAEAYAAMLRKNAAAGRYDSGTRASLAEHADRGPAGSA